MLKNILVTSLATFTLLMSGCGGDSEGESILETQQLLDQGNFSGVIAKLDSSASSDDDYLALGAAYMGKAGFTLPDVVDALTSSTTLGEGEAFASYVKAVIGDEPSPSAFSDLEKANISYTKVVGSLCLAGTKKLSSSEQDVCLYVGLALTTQAATTISLLTDNLGTFGTGEIDPKLQASACAMQYVLDPSKVDGACAVSPKSNVTFSESQKTYGRIEVAVNGTLNDFLLTNNNTATILTVGYCSNNSFETRQDEKKFGYFPCPINEAVGENDVTTGGVLVETLNDGLDLVDTMAPSDMKDDVDEFKCEILGGYFNGYSCSVGGNITEQVVIDYLTKNK